MKASAENFGQILALYRKLTQLFRKKTQQYIQKQKNPWHNAALNKLRLFSLYRQVRQNSDWRIWKVWKDSRQQWIQTSRCGRTPDVQNKPTVHHHTIGETNQNLVKRLMIHYWIVTCDFFDISWVGSPGRSSGKVSRIHAGSRASTGSTQWATKVIPTQ